MTTKTEPLHPIQPIVTAPDGRLRFKGNAIIDHLFNTGKLDLNEIACMGFPQEDRRQIAQLLGYSVSGYGELTSYVRDEDFAVAAKMAAAHEKGKTIDPKDVRIRALEKQLKDLRKALVKPMAALFEKHPDDFSDKFED